MNGTRHKRPARIVFVARPDLLANPGGDTTQILATRAELLRTGIAVRLLLADPSCAALHREIIAECDLVHCFNMLLAHQYEWMIDLAASHGIPVVLSPIFWDMEAYERRGSAIAPWKRVALAVLSSGVGTPASSVLSRRLKSITYNPYFRARVRAILAKCTLLLPNSTAEEVLLQERFGVHLPCRVVHNGCRTLEGTAPRPPGAPDRYILCVGRIERRKNQLSLIRAAAGFGIPLLFLGTVNHAEESYWRVCQRAATRFGVQIVHVDGLPWEDVWPFYVHADAHAQPSWFETPGLSSLEAAAAGCPIVCTDQGSAEEYFGAHAEYCSPRNDASIRDALGRALAAPSRREERRAFVRARYTWTIAAQETLEAYGLLGVAAPSQEIPADAMA
jgi:glycosyltransferase involved in cell wall biosynthesis